METQDTELSALVKTHATYHAAPLALRTQIEAKLADAQREAEVRHLPARWNWGRSVFATGRPHWWSLGGAFSMGIVLAILGMLWVNGMWQQSRISDQVVDSHIRSLMGSHLSDVLSTDQHTVKPWFDGKLNYSPPVCDLADRGFPLAGGRLDYIDGQPVAALVYHHRLHAINVFVWPTRGPRDFVPASTSKQGFNVESWQVDGMEFWAVSDVQAADLHTFAQLLRNKKS